MLLRQWRFLMASMLRSNTWATVLAPELLQLPFKLLLPSPPHHRLGVRDRPRERSVRQLCKRQDGENTYNGPLVNKVGLNNWCKLEIIKSSLPKHFNQVQRVNDKVDVRYWVFIADHDKSSEWLKLCGSDFFVMSSFTALRPPTFFNNAIFSDSSNFVSSVGRQAPTQRHIQIQISSRLPHNSELAKVVQNWDAFPFATISDMGEVLVHILLFS